MYNQNECKTISSGFCELDRNIGKFKRGNLYIIGSRPSVGKTAFALSIVYNIVFNTSNPVKVGFFALEMSGATLMERLFSFETSIETCKLIRGHIDINDCKKINSCIEYFYKNRNNLFIQDTPNIKITDISDQARRMVREDGAQIIFIDYLSLIESDNFCSDKTKSKQIAEIIHSLKALAVELNIPIICLSQISRDPKKDRTPVLADIKDSPSIVQEADCVILLDDPKKRLEANEVKSSCKLTQSVSLVKDNSDNSVRQIKVIIAKNNNNKHIHEIPFYFREKQCLFVE